MKNPQALQVYLDIGYYQGGHYIGIQNVLTNIFSLLFFVVVAVLKTFPINNVFLIQIQKKEKPTQKMFNILDRAARVHFVARCNIIILVHSQGDGKKYTYRTENLIYLNAHIFLNSMFVTRRKQSAF